MADYIYLLENRLSADQQKALRAVREMGRAQGLTVFLVGGAVRDLTSGSPVRDLDVVVQGNALLLRGAIEAAGGVITGEVKAWQALFTRFAGGVRVEIGSTLSATYPKPGKPVFASSTILEDLRRRDFTVNAMALSLNEGSYGLLMDPTNGVADIENRQLRLVSNYGFIEDPVRMIRAARFSARLGWTMDEKTQGRYDTGKEEKYIKALDDARRGYEAEEIFHEEDPLRVLRRLEEEGWMKHLFPALTVAKANAAELDKLREVQTQLQVRGIHPESSAANFPLLTGKLAAPEVAELKRSFVRPGFVSEIEGLDAEAKEFAGQLSGKAGATPSQAWKLLMGAKPEAVLWVAYSSKSPGIQAKLKSFYTEWPKAKQKVPYALMLEMRIVPELAAFDEIVEKLFYELMDGKLETVEEMKAFLEPYSPPAPPPPVRVSRPRTPKKTAKGAKGKKAEAGDEDDELVAVPASADDETDDDDEDDVESEEEATEVLPLRSAAPQRPQPVPELRPSPEPEMDDEPPHREDEQVKEPAPPEPVSARSSSEPEPVSAPPPHEPPARIPVAETPASRSAKKIEASARKPPPAGVTQVAEEKRAAVPAKKMVVAAGKVSTAKALEKTPAKAAAPKVIVVQPPPPAAKNAATKAAAKKTPAKNAESKAPVKAASAKTPAVKAAAPAKAAVKYALGRLPPTKK